MNVADDFETRLRQVEARLDKLESVGLVVHDSETPNTNEKLISMKEYLIQKQPQTAMDKVLTMGYFMETVKGKSLFTAEDIRGCFRLAKTPSPKNINDVINKNITKGYVMESGESVGKAKSWVITATGEILVEKGFGVNK